MKKELAIIFLLIFLSSFVGALGISPAFAEVDFSPGQEITVSYKIISDDPARDVYVTLEGDLKEYAILSKDVVHGTEGVLLTLKLPDYIEKPGLHSVSVVASEGIPEGGAMIGARVIVSSALKVRVPYPGKYVEAKLSIPNGNIDEEIPVGLLIINRGSEKITAQSKVEFFTLDKLAYTLDFPIAMMETNEKKEIIEILNTTGVLPGDYFAKATINYGGEIAAEPNMTFRIGSLFVNVTNFTDFLQRGGIQKFFVDIEGRWNEKLQDVFADVNLSNSATSVMFRTPSVELNAWEKERLEGFVDTTELNGKYQATIYLRYRGEQTITQGEVLVEKKRIKISNSVILAVVSIIVLVAGILVWLYFKKRKSKRK